MKDSRLNPRAPGLTLRGAAAIFARQRTAHSLGAVLFLVAGWRLWLGGFSVWDPLLAAVLISVQPVTEWLIHVFLLHFRPRRLGPITLDFVASADHRSHHADPHDPTYWYIPIRTGVVGFAFVAGVAHLLLPPGLAATAVFTALGLGLFYEWTHYLVHTSYRPRGAWFRRLARHHRLHHFKNEHYWMGVTMHSGDVLLGTYLDPTKVETSETCRTLY